MSVLFRLKRGLAAAWGSQNPVLSDGELGYARDSGIIKIGDGVTPWSGLPTILSSIFLGKTEQAADSNLLDGYDSTQFLKVSDAAAGYLGKTAKAADSELLDGLDSTAYVKVDDTGWVTTGLTITPATSWSVTSYKVRRRNGRVIGTITTAYSGATVTTDAAANFTDLPAVLTMPSGWRNLSGPPVPNQMWLQGQRMFYTIIGTGTAGGEIAVVSGTFPSENVSAGNYTFVLDYMVD